MTDEGRRHFLSKYIKQQAGRCINGFEEGLKEAQQKAEFERFFETYESSYALTLAYPDDIMLDTAKNFGIQTENRPKIDIVKELFIKQGGF